MSGWCDRPGCSEVAVAAFGFDGAARVVWLGDARPGQRGAAGHLCRVHAERMRAPRGWTVRERRGEPPSPGAPTEPVRPADPVRPAEPALPAEPAVAAREPATADVATGGPDASAPAWDPTGAPGVELDAVLDARTPMLARAFQAARRRGEERSRPG